MTSWPNRDRSSNDRVLSRKWRMAACSALLAGCGVAGLTTSTTAASIDKMLQSTPLVLKDGRIAEVSVHTIPFPDDAVAPASKTKNRLNAFTQQIATDCFLTAQVIGHVDKSETSGRETADIHRLARARADTIQASLIENGLPAASIASVWDWRFMVQQARVTLWVFRLTAGDDCEDAPLGSPASDQVAAVDTPAQTTVPANATPPKAAETNGEAARSTPVAQKVIPAAKPKNAEVTTRIPAAPSTAKAAATGSEQKTTSPAETKTAALSQSSPPDPKGSIKIVDSGALEVVFATNSSYFPEGAGDRLRAFINTLDQDKSYVLRIQTSVDGAADVSGVSSENEAARYNAWLAERRFKRVEAWLLKNSDGRQLKLEPSLIENDGSRRVLVEPAPLG